MEFSGIDPTRDLNSKDNKTDTEKKKPESYLYIESEEAVFWGVNVML